MPTQPKLKSTEVIDRINRMLIDAHGPLGSDDFVVLRLLQDAKSSIQADPVQGHNALACVYQLAGDYDSAMHHLEIALQLDPGFSGTHHNMSAISGNFGYFSKAQLSFVIAARPEAGFMTFFWNSGFSCGAFQSMVKFFDAAQSMKIDTGGLDIETARAAVDVLDRASVTEQDIACVLDVAGEVLRENELFYLGDRPDIAVYEDDEVSPFIRMHYWLGVSPEEAANLYFEFVDRLTSRLEAIPSVLSVSFGSKLESDERIAA